MSLSILVITLRVDLIKKTHLMIHLLFLLPQLGIAKTCPCKQNVPLKIILLHVQILYIIEWLRGVGRGGKKQVGRKIKK